nr:EOG090X0864 [Eulimnadia texana]
MKTFCTTAIVRKSVELAVVLGKRTEDVVFVSRFRVQKYAFVIFYHFIISGFNFVFVHRIGERIFLMIFGCWFIIARIDTIVVHHKRHHHFYVGTILVTLISSAFFSFSRFLRSLLTTVSSAIIAKFTRYSSELFAIISSSRLSANKKTCKEYQIRVVRGSFLRPRNGVRKETSEILSKCKKKLYMAVTGFNETNPKKLWELIEPCDVRITKLREFLTDVEPSLEYKIVPIIDPYGPTASKADLQLLVVSEETLPGAAKVNNLRNEKGLPLLDVHPIELVADQFACVDEESKISSSSLRKRLLGTHLKPPKSKPHTPYVIGLTGGIASGKTSIAKRLQDLGARVVPCDQLGHRAYKKGTNCYQGLVEHFGAQILDSDEEIDRKKLGPIVFQNKAELQKLNSLVWPEIRRLYLEEIESSNSSVVVLDAAILLEAGWDEDCDEVWVSFVPKDEAVKRITDRDKLPESAALSRIESQLSNSERLAKADVALCSLWDYDITAAQVKKAWDQVQDFLNKKDAIE